MIKKLSRIGNSYGLILDRSILDLLGIQPDTPLEVTTNGKGLVVTPIVEEDDHATKVMKSARRMAEIHKDTFKRLAE
jgi:antitoxin MazE